MTTRFAIVMLMLGACTAAGGDYVDAGGGGGGTGSLPTWSGTSDITGPDSAVFHSTFQFAADQYGHYHVASGEVDIVTPPTSSQPDCTLTIDASHPIGTNDGTIQPDDAASTIQGSGTTVWLATYTFVCPTGTQTTMLPYQAAWWPMPPGAPPAEPVVNGSASFQVDEYDGTGTVSIHKD